MQYPLGEGDGSGSAGTNIPRVPFISHSLSIYLPPSQVAIIFARRTKPTLSLLCLCCPLTPASPSLLVHPAGSLTPARLLGLSHAQPSAVSSNVIPQQRKSNSLERLPGSLDILYCLWSGGK